MQQQQIEGQRAQTILVVESDESTRRILDLSLRHAGFAVRVASNAEEGGRRLADRPDLIIVGADNDDGLDFCRRAKQADTLAPAVVLMLDPGVDSKRRGLEAGADDFVARPIYVQEVVARSRALLQRRDRERLELSAHDNERFVSNVEDVPLVDLLRAIAANQKSGVALVMGGEGARGELYFRQGRVVDAEVGRLSGRDAVYRLFCWSSGSLAVEWKSIRRKDTIEMATHDLLMEALRRVDEWRRLLAGVPALDTIFEVDYRLLAERLADIPDEVNRILRLFDGVRTFLQVIDDCGLPDLDGVAAIGKLYRERIIHDIRLSVEDDETVTADMEGWLSDAAGPFRSPSRHERDLFGGGPDAGVGVHGRRTAPIDPLGEGAREALDDDMRVRFTDRLQAEGATAAAEAAGRGGEPGRRHPGAAAGGADRFRAGRQRHAPEHAARHGHGQRRGIASRGGDCGRRHTACVRGGRRARRRVAAGDAAGEPAAAAATATSPLERPYGWSSTEPGQPRSASGEILVQKSAAQPAVAAGRAARARARGFRQGVRAQVDGDAARQRASARRTAAGPGAGGSPGASHHARAGEAGRQQDHQGRRRPRRRVLQGRRRGRAGRIVARQEGASASSPGPSRLVVAIVAIKVKTGHKRPLVEDPEPKELASAPAPAQPVQPVIVPIADDARRLVRRQDGGGGGGRDRRRRAQAGRTARRRRDELDERTADPRMVRDRVERGASAAVRVPHGVRPEADA